MKFTLIVATCLFFSVAIIFLNLGYWLSAPANEPVKSDLIVSLGGGKGERDQMAVDLYKAGYAKKILLTGMGISLNDGLNYYKSTTTQFYINQGVASEALLFDGYSINTHQETLNLAALLTAHHWHSALVVSDPPHLRRLDFCLSAVLKKAGLSYRLIASTVPTWQADRWWQEERWRQFCLSEMVKLIFYAVVYGV